MIVKKKVFGVALAFSLLLSAPLALGGEANEGDVKTVIEWDGNTQLSEWSYEELGRLEFSHDVSFDSLGSNTIEVRYGDDVLTSREVIVSSPSGRYDLILEPDSVRTEEEKPHDAKPELQQRVEGLFAEIQVHEDDVYLGDMITVDVTVMNELQEERTIFLYLVHENDTELLYEDVVSPAGDIRGHEISFVYDLEDAHIPSELFVECTGHAARYRHRRIEVQRPTEPFELVRWTGDYRGDPKADEIVVTMDQDREIRAHFGEERYDLNVDTLGEGEVNLEPSKTSYERNEKVHLEATAEKGGWQFSHWIGDHPEGEQFHDEITVTMDRVRRLKAVFENVDTSVEHELNVNVEGEGVVELEPEKETYHQGEAVRLQAIPAGGWQFDRWVGDILGTDEEITIVMDNHKDVTATFDDDITYSLDVSIHGEGRVDRNPFRLEYSEGTAVTLTATPEDTLILEDIDRGDMVGDFHDDMTVAEGNIRENLYEQASTWLSGNTDVTDIPELEETDPLDIMFGKRNQDWLEDPEPLEGQYEISIRMDGIDIDVQDAQLVVYERANDTEESFLSRYGMFLIPIIALILVAIFVGWKKKKEPEKDTIPQQPPGSDDEEQASKDEIPECPRCGDDLRYIKEYERWYCDKCRGYK